MVKKVKISATKRTQHLRGKKKIAKPSSKLKSAKAAANKKPETLKSGNSSRKEPKVRNRKGPPVPAPLPRGSDSESDEANDYANMMDEEDLEFLKQSVKNQSYQSLSKLSAVHETTSRKRKHNAADEEEAQTSRKLEVEYGKISSHEYEASGRDLVDLLPIKTKEGLVIGRTTKIDRSKVQLDKNAGVTEEDEEELVPSESEPEDSDADIIDDVASDDEDGDEKTEKAISTADLLVRREQDIDKQRYRIGIICSGILEKPEDKMKNFIALLDMVDERNRDSTYNLFTIRKLAIVSMLEVFKDILPEYRIGIADAESAKLKKTTLERVTYENALLQQYKKYLTKLEKVSSVLSKKKSGKRVDEQRRKLGELAVECMCDLICCHPYFNFSQNIAQLLVYLSNSRTVSVRTRVNACFREIFRTDKKLDLSLYIVRRINHLVKSKSNGVVYVDVMSCLTSLPIKAINLDAEKENELKQKKLEARQKRVVNLSKRERKRRKKMVEVEKELMETKAEENKLVKQSKLTEITKMVFTIYFRILKNEPNSKMLSSTLEGLAKFAHVINLEYFSDLVNVLNNLIQNADLGYREQLYCTQTVFSILSGQGESLNIDPCRFYTHIYRNMLLVSAGKNHPDIEIILSILHDVIIKRRKHITQHRMVAFVKRLAMVSMQLLHHGTIACLGLLKTLMQLTSSLQVVLDTEEMVGSGRYDPHLDDPEYCNSNCTALYEVAALARHYHPTVVRMAKHIVAGVPATGDGSLHAELGKLTPQELYEQFDSTQMSFNPSIPTPKSNMTKQKRTRHFYADADFEDWCRIQVRPPKKHTRSVPFDFCADVLRNVDSK